MKHTVSQRRAIDSSAPEIVCIAGPGSGKTATTVSRIVRVFDDGIPLSKVVCLTFTNAAADELQERLANAFANRAGLLNPPDIYRLGFIGTLHGFALKMLKLYGGDIGYGDRIAIVGEEAAADLLASKAVTLGCKTRLMDLMKLKSAPMPARGARLSSDQLVIRGYYEDLREAGLVDFDTILTEFLRLLQGCTLVGSGVDCPHLIPFDYLFVDEVQDSAEIDWAIYDELPMSNKFYVGDPDQAIYSFRGGRVDLLLKKADALRPIKDALIYLQENFRSHLEICQASDRLIGHNKGRLPKHSISVSGEGGSVTVMDPCAINEGAEIGAVAAAIKIMSCPGPYPTPLKEIAILARTNAICHAYRTTLKACGIPVVEPAKVNFPMDWGVAKALVELLANPQNDTLFFFYLLAYYLHKGEPVGIARKNVQQMFLDARSKGMTLNESSFQFKAYALADIPLILQENQICKESCRLVAGKIKRLGPSADILQLALAMALPETEQAEASEGVTVCTIHGAKGKEWDVVFIVGFEDEVIPGRAASMNGVQHRLDTMIVDFRADPVEEERRLAFVAVSRARKAVYLAHAESRVTPWGKTEGHRPSRFIKELLDS